MRSAYRVGDRIAMLYQGRVRAVGTVDEIRASPDPVVRGFVEGRPRDPDAEEAEPLSQREEVAVEGSQG
jgi:phospholipid/cholesterol/gamma-HCH transport system ATP-binding protein